MCVCVCVCVCVYSVVKIVKRVVDKKFYVI